MSLLQETTGNEIPKDVNMPCKNISWRNRR